MKIEIVKRHCFLITFLCIIITLESILSIILPYLSKLLLDKVIIDNHYSLLSMIILSFAVIIISIAIFVPLLVEVGLIRASILTVGDLVAFNAYTNMLFSPITLLIC